MKNKGYAKIAGTNKVHYGKCGSGVKDLFTNVARVYANLSEQKKAFA